MRALLGLALGVAAAVVIGPGLGPGVAEAKAKKRAPPAAHRVVPQQQIACTAIGCVPVPRGCGQAPGRTWSGLPTGNDVIVCPPGVAPFR